MKEIESEEQHRLWFFRQLEVITNKLDTLPLTNTVSPPACFILIIIMFYSHGPAA